MKNKTHYQNPPKEMEKVAALNYPPVKIFFNKLTEQRY
jgi:hypothetical protein